MTDHPSSAGLEETLNLVARNGQTADSVPSRRGSARSSEAPEASLPAPTESVDVRQTVARPPSAKLALPNGEVADAQTSLRHTFPHLYHSSGASRSPSTRTSSSSLQALNEDTVVDARSDHGLWTKASGRRMSHRSSNDAQPADFPVYPDQSYAVLQSQIHPTYHPPFLRSRSSYPARTESLGRLATPRTALTAGNTPVSSPGLFSVHSPRSTPNSDDEGRISSPYLHPTHLQPPKETHTAEVDRDLVTGNKLINQYEILEELGRGEHGKVKLGRHVTTRQKVAIKIVQRYSKRRRLGKLGNPEDKVKKEVAILKKARHPNVVSLLEVIDDPNRQKVYIVLEFVENGEIIWRKKGLREIVQVDKRRLEREKAGVPETPSFWEESRQYVRTAQRLRRQREKARERRQRQAAHAQQGPIPAWSLEHGAESDEEEEVDPAMARTISRTISRTNLSADDTQESPSHSLASAHDSALAAIEGTMYGAYADYSLDRRFSTASSSMGYAPSEPDWVSDDDDMSYVPCLTVDEARNAFRDSLLGLEYLHYQGIIHRDIKPANLLVTSNHRVKISDFGVSYLGRPMRDEEEEQVAETDATELDDARELSKTVGTPAFYAPELCYTGDDFEQTIGSVPKITGAIDVWSLGVTLYGMIFGRLPFVSDDEYSMFQTIVKKDVFIPRKRLQPVEDAPESVSQWPRYANNEKRMEDELAYEEIDDELFDLLKRLLTKDPVKRITVKEIKHHPWVLHGLPNPRAWIDETDPAYQSKGKKIEVSNEEVTTAVSKVPFIQRVRSNVAKLSNYLTGRSKDKDKEGRKRTSSTTPSVESSASSSASLGRLLETRRGSLKEEDFYRPSRLATKDAEHPLSHSVTASPVGRDHQTSYFDDVRTDATVDRTPRPDPPHRAASTLSTAGSTKTIRPDWTATLSASQRGSASSRVENHGTAHVGGLLGGAGRRLARGLQSREWRSDRSIAGDTPDSVSLDGDRHSEPSLALSVASAVGHLQSSSFLRDEDTSYSHTESLSAAESGHRRNRSHHLTTRSSHEPFQFTKDVLLRKRRSDIGQASVIDQVPPESKNKSTDSLSLRPEPQPEMIETANDPPSGGLTTSPPSAATISSSSVDDYTSGMSQSASHPSIPSVISGASSLSGDGSSKDKECEPAVQVPSILRTGETVKARLLRPRRSHEDDESRYYCDDENDSEDDSEDEVLVIGRKKPTSQKPVICGPQASKPKA